MPRALITGIAGQDGHYLSELLLARGYEVVGISRNATRTAPKDGVTLRDIDVNDHAALERLFADFAFDEVYNLAGQSFGPDSWTYPVETASTLGVSVVQLLELVRQAGRPMRFFQASSSELFGIATESPQRETTPFRPITPYGFAKQLAHATVGAYRARYGVFAACGILFNHESPLRRPEFVTRKVTREVARIRAGMSTRLQIGNLDARRDWSFAGDIAEGMWRVMQAAEPDDFVLASGVSHSVRDLCEIAFARVGLDYRDYVEEEPALVRGADFDRVGDPSKAARILGWTTTTSFRDLIGMMVDADIRKLSEES
ncbi:MAG TPA: GDP-mannose 4,6-dehydratase [Thermoanaerobaculia bacterium]|nr:GDP-mannose 4,6-dehydratase [Thermoanaerobaculia bacterium]